jgi:hypothetical protein
MVVQSLSRVRGGPVQQRLQLSVRAKRMQSLKRGVPNICSIGLPLRVVTNIPALFLTHHAA